MYGRHLKRGVTVPDYYYRVEVQIPPRLKSS